MDKDKLDKLMKELGELHDADLEYIFKNIDRLDFDRIRRICNWLTHRRQG